MGEDKRIEIMKNRQQLEKQGYIFFKSLKAGVNSTYTFKKAGVECAIGFDSINEAVSHINKQMELDKNPFMIF